MSLLCGIITFYSSQHAVQAEKVLAREGFTVELIPGPKDISPNCGVALKCDRDRLLAVGETLRRHQVMFEACHEYCLQQQKSLLDKLLGR
ncbi:DUF3343 domain-containing protein [Sporolituus thermophilus]|uniref:Putative Se/S carrier protein-like domain-containing protein n=1 Tax=Sporolituus thermophilus DSM 23256 TaxID=1123285 RepID=A0A1G7MCG5_9FIRM|nr:DUF3343 domain-containing protein [Sporolituus thermophilus]SDF59381.1 Protein of unknown function [Sporolituus thermophilus DSM 23256]